MHIVLKEGDSMIADMAFERRTVVIGSEASCEVHLPDMRIGARHAAIVPDEQRGWCVEHLDEGSTTLLNGSVLRERVPLHDGDEIVIHDYLLKVYVALLNHEEPTAVAAEPTPTLRRAASVPTGALVKKPDDPISLGAGRLHRACQIGQSLGRCGDVRALMDLTLATVLSAFSAQRAWMGVRRQPSGGPEFIEGRTTSGASCDQPALARQLAEQCLDRSRCVCLVKTDQADTASAMAVPLAGAEGNLGMIYVDARQDASSYQPTDLDLLRLIAQHAALQVEAIVHEQVKQQRAVSTGVVVLGHEVQARLDPRGLPQWDEMQVTVYCKPGQNRFGDVYDVLRMPSGAAAVLFGHANATGADAVLMTTQTTAAFRIGVLHGDAPHAMLRELNWLIHDKRRLSTLECWAMVIDPKTGAICYAAAGCPRAVVIDCKGDARTLPPGDMPEIGALKNVNYDRMEAQLGQGETLVLFSGGIAVAANSRGEALGEQRFIESLCDGFGQAAGALLNEVLTDLREYLRDGHHPDDVTIIVVHRQ